MDGDFNYNLDYDFDQDGSISLGEIVYVGYNYLKTREVIR